MRQIRYHPNPKLIRGYFFLKANTRTIKNKMAEIDRAALGSDKERNIGKLWCIARGCGQKNSLR
jgi:hypothetical protein